MSEYKLKATTRIVKGEKIRDNFNLPAVVYGAGKNNINLVLNYQNFIKLYDTAGTSSLIDLILDDKEEGKVLVHDLQYDPVSDRINHIDLKRIEMGKEMEASVELEFIAEAPAIKEMGGTLVKNLEEVIVRCLPKDLPSELTVDLSTLKTFEDSIRVKDLILSTGVVIVSPSENDVIVKAIPALTEEELKAMDEAGTDTNVADVEVAGEKKDEDKEVTDDEKKEADKEDKKDNSKSEEKK